MVFFIEKHLIGCVPKYPPIHLFSTPAPVPFTGPICYRENLFGETKPNKTPGAPKGNTLCIFQSAFWHGPALSSIFCQVETFRKYQKTTHKKPSRKQTNFLNVSNTKKAKPNETETKKA